MESVKVEQGENVLIWCSEHWCYHKMSYTYLLELVPAQSHSQRGH